MAVSFVHQILYGVSLGDECWSWLKKEKSLRQLLLDLSEAHLKDLEKNGLLPKGK